MDLKKFMDQGTSHAKARPNDTYNKAAAKAPYKPVKQHPNDDDENAPDPDWIEFDPEKERTKFFGHVMADEASLREKIVVKKEKKIAKEADRKEKAIDLAKRLQLTTEQRDLIASNENQIDMSKIDQSKLKEAQAIIAQIESESYSKYDIDFESKHKGGQWTSHEE